MRPIRLIHAAILALGLLPGIARAQEGAVRVLVSNGLRGAFDPARAAAQAAIGRPLAVQYGTAVELQTKIESGQGFDAALLPRNVADALAAKGKIQDNTDIGRALVGLEIRGDAPPGAEIGTAAGIKAVLLGAKQVRYLAGGASSKTIESMIAKLGIGPALAGRTVTDSSDLTFAPVAGPGEYELVFNLNSELKPVNGWRPLGTVPQQFQVPVIETVGIGPGGDRSAAKALVGFLQGPMFGQALTASGLSR